MNARDIRRRIRAVENTRKITRAMELVARTKLKRAQDQARAAKPYSEALQDLLGRLGSASAHEYISDLLKSRPISRTMMVVFAGDRGLCGSYNNNVLRLAEDKLDELTQPGEVDLVTVGKRAGNYFRWREADIYEEFVDVGEEANLSLARHLGNMVSHEYADERVDQVLLVYTQFITVFQHPPRINRLLPLDLAGADENFGGDGPGGAYLHEPSPEIIFEELLPRFVRNTFYCAITEAKASEHASRVMAMKSATDNASDLIDELTLEHNRVRKTQITREITEIVGGAEVLASERQ